MVNLRRIRSRPIVRQLFFQGSVFQVFENNQGDNDRCQGMKSGSQIKGVALKYDFYPFSICVWPILRYFQFYKQSDQSLEDSLQEKGLILYFLSLKSIISIIERYYIQYKMVNPSFTDSSLNAVVRLIMLLTMISVAVSVSSIPYLSDAIGSYQFTISLSPTNMTGAMSVQNYVVTPTSSVYNVLQSTAVLAGFQYNTKPQFMFRLFPPTFNTTTTQFTIGMQVLAPCNFLFMKFYLIYITQQSLNYLEVQAVNHTCIVANGAIGSSKTEAITFPTRLYVGPSDLADLKTIAFVSSILLYTQVGATTSAFAFTLNTPAPTVSGFTGTVILTTPATITEIYVTILILKKNLMPEEQMPYIAAGYKVDQTQLIATAGACSNSFGIPATYGGTGYNRNCTVALGEANDDYNTALPRKIDFDSTMSPNFTTCLNTAQTNTALVQQLFFGVVCFYKGTCPNSTFYFDKTVPDCRLCSGLNGQCLTCNVSQCYTCASYYYPSGLNCLACTQLHCIDCLTNTTCAKCDNTTYVNTTSVCAPCTNLAFCTLCLTNVTCISCVNNTYVPDVTGACTLCYLLLIECLTCVNYYTCTNCNISYYISAGGSCFPCTSAIGSCTQCSNASYCSDCQSGYYLSSSNVSCTLCAVTFPNCGLCSSNASCTTCQLGYYAFNATTCSACTLTACIDCTSNTTCVQCQQSYFITATQSCQTCSAKHCINCPNSTSCLSCESDFTLTGGNSCVCTTGWQVTNVCISVLGCVTAVKINSVSTCLFCDNLANFIISGNTCNCKTGYKLTNYSVCVTVCGDTLIFGSQTCDDGNTNSGDGCSSTCMEQPNYKCVNTTSGYLSVMPYSYLVKTVGLYQCIFKADFTVSLQYIWRDPSSNTGSYYFSISPTSPNFNKQPLGFMTLTISNITGYKVTGYTYLDGIIQCDVTFVQNLQNLPAVLYMNFDTNLFNTTNFVYTFLSTGTNAPLIVSGYTSHIQYLTIGSYVVLGLACFIMLLSVIFEKMIAIETVNYLQLLVFCKLVYIQEDFLVDTGLKTLGYIAGYNQIGQNLAQTHTLPQPYRRLIFNNDFLLNFQTGLVLMGISLILLIIFSIYRWRFLSKFQKTCASKDDYRLKEQTLNSRARFIYQRLIFLVACITLFQAFAALRIQGRSLDSDSHFNYFLINLLSLIFAVVYTLGVLTYEVINTGKAHEWMAPFCSYSPYYVGYYVVWALIMTPVMAVGQIILGVKAIFICGGIVFINLIVLAIWRPYNQIIHNVGIILNHLVVLGFLGFEATMSIKPFEEPVHFIASYTLLGLILLMELLAMIRIYFAYRPPIKEVPKLMRNQVAQMEQESKVVIENLEKDYLGRSNKKKMGKRQEEDDDYLRRLKARLKKEIKENQNAPTEEI